MKDQVLTLSFADNDELIDDPAESISPDFFLPSTRSESELPTETPELDLEFDEVGSDSDSQAKNDKSVTYDLVSLLEFDGLDTEDEEHDADKEDASRQDQSALVLAACENRVKRLGMLCDQGLDKDGQDENGVTPLQMACSAGHVDVVNCLCHLEVDVDKANSKGLTPLCIATQAGHTEIVCRLCIAGANVDALDPDGKSALHIAASEGDMKIIQMLCSISADIHKPTHRGATPLLGASFHGRLKAVQFLCEEGASYETTDEEGWTPLYAGCFCGHLGVVRYLLSISAEPQQSANDGSTPLSISQQQGHSSVAAIVQKSLELPEQMLKRRATFTQQASLKSNRSRARSSASQFGDLPTRKGRRTVMQDTLQEQFQEIFAQNDELSDLIQSLRRENKDLRGLMDSREPSQHALGDSGDASDNALSSGTPVNTPSSPQEQRETHSKMQRSVMHIVLELNRKLKSEAAELRDEMQSMRCRSEIDENRLEKARNDMAKMQGVMDETQTLYREKDMNCEQSLTEARLMKDELRQEMHSVKSLQVQLNQAQTELEDELQHRMHAPLSLQLADSWDCTSQLEKLQEERDRLQEELVVLSAADHESRMADQAVIELAVEEINEAQKLAKHHESATKCVQEEYAEKASELACARQELNEFDNVKEELASNTQEKNMAKAMRIASEAVQQARDAAGKGFKENTKLREELQEMRAMVTKGEHTTQEAVASHASSTAHILKEEMWQVKARGTYDLNMKLHQQEDIIETLRREVHQSRVAQFPEELRRLEDATDRKASEISLLEQSVQEALRKSREEEWTELRRVENKASQKQSELQGEVAFFKRTCEELREQNQECMETEYKNRKASEQWRRKHRKLQLENEDLEQQMENMRSRRNSSKLREETSQLNEHRQKLLELEEETLKLSVEVGSRLKPQELTDSSALKDEVRAAAHAAQKARISSYEASLLVKWNEDLEEECDKLHDQVRKLGVSSDFSTSDFLSPISQAGTVVSDSLQTSAFSLLSPHRSGYRAARLRPDSPLLGKSQSPIMKHIRPSGLDLTPCPSAAISHANVISYMHLATSQDYRACLFCPSSLTSVCIDMM